MLLLDKGLLTLNKDSPKIYNNFWSGIGESNPSSLLGKQMLDRSTNPALVGVRGIEPPASRSQTERSTDELHPVSFQVLVVGVEPTSLLGTRS